MLKCTVLLFTSTCTLLSIPLTMLATTVTRRVARNLLCGDKTGGLGDASGVQGQSPGGGLGAETDAIFQVRRGDRHPCPPPPLGNATDSQ